MPADYIEVDVTRLAIRLPRFDAVKPIRRGTGGPGARPRGPDIEGRVGVAQLFRLLRSHDAGVDEGRGGIRDLRVRGFGGDCDGDAMLPGKRGEIRGAKAAVPNLDDMTQRTSSCFFRQKLQERFEVARIEFHGGHELP